MRRELGLAGEVANCWSTESLEPQAYRYQTGVIRMGIVSNCRSAIRTLCLALKAPE